MQKRIVFLLFLNVGVILVSLGIISHLSVTASIERSLENRLMLANIIGRYVDYVIESNVKRLYDVSLSGKIDLEDNDWDPERKALKTAMEYSIFTGRIFLLDRRGRVLLRVRRAGRLCGGGAGLLDEAGLRALPGGDGLGEAPGQGRASTPPRVQPRAATPPIRARGSSGPRR